MPMRPTLILIALWLAALAVSLPAAYHLSNHPGILLGIEEGQPAVGVRVGRELLAGGRLREAARSFERARDFFLKLYGESGLEQHKIHATTALIALADAYKNHGDAPEWREAVGLYHQAIEDYPNANHGYWTLSLGEVHQKLGQHAEAIGAYTQTIESGRGHARLLARHGRGRSYLATEQWDAAGEDLAWFAKFYNRPMGGEQWREMLALERAENAAAGYALARARAELGMGEEAKEPLERYLERFPNDPEALYLNSLLTDAPIPVSEGEIPEGALFPPAGGTPRPVTDLYFNLYADAEGPVILELALSIEEGLEELPQVTVECRGISTTIIPAGAAPAIHAARLELARGRNHVTVQVKAPGFFESYPGVFLHRAAVTAAEA